MFECSFSHAYVICPGCVFVCCHFSVVDNVSDKAVIVKGAVFFYAAVARFWRRDGCLSAEDILVVFVDDGGHVFCAAVTNF